MTYVYCKSVWHAMRLSEILTRLGYLARIQTDETSVETDAPLPVFHHALIKEML